MAKLKPWQMIMLLLLGAFSVILLVALFLNLSEDDFEGRTIALRNIRPTQYNLITLLNADAIYVEMNDESRRILKDRYGHFKED